MERNWKSFASGSFLVAILALGLCSSALATGTPELMLTSGGTSITKVGIGNSVFFNGIVNGRSVFLEAGASNSPHLSPSYGIDLASIQLMCALSSCQNDPLTITLSDIGFTDVPPALFSSYTAITQTTTGPNAPSVSQTSWWGPSSYFSETTQIGSTIGFTGAPIVGQTATTGGGGPTAPYSLTAQDVFSANQSGTLTTIFNGTGDIGAAPEPRTMLLFGSGLLAMASFVRRLRRA